MQWIKAIGAELFGLFVDDGSFAVAILLWVAAVWLVLPLVALSPGARGPVLFAGLAVILVESAWRRSGR